MLVKMPKGRKKSRTWLVSVFTLVVVIAFAVLIISNRHLYSELANFSAGPMLVVMLLTALPDRALINLWLFRAIGARLSFIESYGLTAAGTLAGQLPLAGGLAAKGLYLRRRYQVPYGTYVSATAGLFIVAISAAGLSGIAGLVLNRFYTGANVPWLLMAGFVLMALTSIIFAHNLDELLAKVKWHNLGARLASGFALLSRNRSLMLKLNLMSVIGVILFAIRLWAAFRLFSTNVPLHYCLVFSAATTLTQLVGLAPGGLGVRELIIAALGALTQVDPAVSIVAVGLERILSVTMSGFLAVLVSPLLGHNLLSEVSQ